LAGVRDETKEATYILDDIVSIAGLIVNPRSGKSSGKGLALAQKLNGKDVHVRILDRFETLPQHMRDFSSAGVTDLFISSGDGTIQAIQTMIAEGKAFTHAPRLCLLPHGTTNMTAADLGFRIRNVASQAAFIEDMSPRDVRARPTLRAANPSDGRPRHGMFLGTGAASEATLFAQRELNAKGVKGNTAVIATLGRAAFKAMFTAPNPHDKDRFDRPFDIRVTSGGHIYSEGPQLMMLATTLQKLVLGAKPFWGGAAGPIRASVFPYPTPSILRWLLPIMYGGERRGVPKGAMSFSGHSLEITSPVSYVIDGEFFDGPKDCPLKVETGPVFTYVCS
jgi:diacylglycerol kinase (ATP)